MPAAFCGGFFKMILEITTVLFLIHGLGMLSRLFARRRDVLYYVSGPVHGPN
jgi:hypothetical protein